MLMPVNRLFREAVRALDAGDVERLAALLDEHPSLARHWCRTGKWYESGYFAGATLLQHVAGNPDRGSPLPTNVVEIARLLLGREVDQRAVQDTAGLVLTSRQASEAGVALPLLDLLVAAGATVDLADPELLSAPLLNHAPATAEELIRRGAAMDLRHAAALGRVEAVRDMLALDIDREMLEEALAFACVCGRSDTAAVLVRHGARGDVLVTPGGRPPRTALHEAANRGHDDLVRLLVDSGADPSVAEPRWGGTAADWAEHGGHPEIAAALRPAAPPGSRP
jgi:Ankyrin repeats (many copies)